MSSKETKKEELFEHVASNDFLKFAFNGASYEASLQRAIHRTGRLCAISVTERTLSDGRKVIWMAHDFKFLGGSLGTAEGEKLVLGFGNAESDADGKDICCSKSIAFSSTCSTVHIGSSGSHIWWSICFVCDAIRCENRCKGCENRICRTICNFGYNVREESGCVRVISPLSFFSSSSSLY